MEEKLSEAVQQKTAYFYGLEHPSIYTSGVSFSPKDVIDKDIEFIQTRRGGSITVHNPGQLIFYNVFPISLIQNNLALYIRILEYNIISYLNSINIDAFILPPHSGVWTTKGKIAFIGIGAKKGCIYHGASINIRNNKLAYDKIYSCGLKFPIATMKDFNAELANKIVLKDCASYLFDKTRQQLLLLSQDSDCATHQDNSDIDVLINAPKNTLLKKMIDFANIRQYQNSYLLSNSLSKRKEPTIIMMSNLMKYLARESKQLTIEPNTSTSDNILVYSSKKYQSLVEYISWLKNKNINEVSSFPQFIRMKDYQNIHHEK